MTVPERDPFVVSLRGRESVSWESGFLCRDAASSSIRGLMFVQSARYITIGRSEVSQELS